MVLRLVSKAGRGDHVLRDACSVPAQVATGLSLFTSVHFWRPSMQWTTPTACDLRFGFEITMYVSAR
jgi:coenzyme PQQ precursor peptide PqqA